MQDIKDYNEYKELFNDDLVKAVRNLLRRIEDGDVYELEDSSEHNALKTYFNKFALHRQVTKEQFKNWSL